MHQVLISTQPALSHNRLDSRVFSRVRFAVPGLLVATLEVDFVSLLAGDVSRRNPLVTVPRLETLLAVHEVDVLQTEGARFEKEEPNKGGGSQVGSDKDETITVTDTSGGNRSKESNHD